MTTQLDILQTGQAWKGLDMAIATVVSTWGSAPRPRGSHMLMAQDGRFVGSVSGGCVETEILFFGAEVAAGASAVLKKYGVSNASAWQAGLPCGGEIEVLVQPVRAGAFDPEFFGVIAEQVRRGQSQIVATDLQQGRSECVDEPRSDRFNNVYLARRRMILVGAVDIAQSLARIAVATGFDVVVIDPRARFLTRERFPDALLDGRWPDVALDELRLDAESSLVTLSHDSKIDDAALIAALRSRAGYIAALGSTRSHAARIERLVAAGIDRDAIARIEGPAGVRIGAVGPEEIALSIAAGAVAALRLRT